MFLSLHRIYAVYSCRMNTILKGEAWNELNIHYKAQKYASDR